MEHDIAFFRDEVRSGFYVPTVMKQAWAAELQVLAEIDRICSKYGLTYFADWGTLLGTVRHGGFIPWDDDLDICMKREDYNRFKEVAEAELPPEYRLHDYERHDNHWLFLTRVVNGEKISFDERHLDQTYNFPWLSCVDIFVLDYLYQTEEEEKQRDQDVLEILQFADYYIQGKIRGDAAKKLKQIFEKKYSRRLPAVDQNRAFAVELYRLAEEVMSRVASHDTDRLGQIFPWVLKGNRGFPKEYYQKSIRLPFEDTTIPVPYAYKEVLSARFGDWFTIKKDWEGHDYPFFEGQRKNMEKLAGEPVMRFTARPEMLLPIPQEKKYSLKQMAKRCLEEFIKEQQHAEEIINEKGRDTESIRQTFVDCQQIAIAFGNVLEQTKGEANKRIVRVVETLEVYCEEVYQGFWAVGTDRLQEQIARIGEVLTQLSDAVKTNITSRREVLFLPISPEGMRDLFAEYRSALMEPDTDVSVVPLPLTRKDCLGREVTTGSEIYGEIDLDGYPGGISYTDWETYQLSHLCPDVIYIQYPYDEENTYLTIPVDFYAKNLKKYTDRLIYIPFPYTTDFDAGQERDCYVLKQYACSAAVIYADEIRLASAGLKAGYIRALTEFFDAKAAKRMGKKIKLRRHEERTEDEPLTKTLLFCIGLNELTACGEKMLSSLKSRLELLHQSGDALRYAVSVYPMEKQAWIKEDAALAEEIFSMIAHEEMYGGGFEEAAELFDAYYGSPSPFVIAFVSAQKPVMISDYHFLTETNA